jgi:NADPH:quinone reductase-like Zn-dependent oxidoreductase
VVDYTREDFSRAGRVYDIVVDTVGHSGFSRSMRSLKRGGFYVRVGGSGQLLSLLGAALQVMWASVTGAAKVVGGVARGAPEGLSFLKGLMETGKLQTVIDKRYPLDEIVEAHRYAETGHKKGNVVVVLEAMSR